MTSTDRSEHARRAFNGVAGYEALNAHLNAMLGYVMDGQWHPGNSMSQRDAIELVELLPETDLAALLPGHSFTKVPDGFAPLMVLDGVQYLRSTHFIGCRQGTGPIESYCLIHAWPTSEVVRRCIERTARWR